ncbi:FHA domain-containing protein [Diaphorobacter sp.]|uniref:FHA domain-containing protein n=1 Tax=Diaphorobacter sp. TaxID=1934310 RepID=UPI0025885BFB|nr:FHA domain-containing protein [Diaphorobacter sp.]
MPRMVVSIDGVVIKEVTFTKERTTVGRRPYNDVVIDNLAVSGEHAVFLMNGDDVEVEDLGSTNGTYVNGKAIKRQPLRNGDTVELGKYKIRFLHEEPGHDYEKTMVFKPGMLPPFRPETPAPAPALAAITASVRVMTGPAAGREVALAKVVTTIGKPGVAVASITKRHGGFVLAHVEGGGVPLLNGEPVSDRPVALKNGDRIALASTEMEFVQSANR